MIFSIAYVPFVGGAELAVKNITDRINDWQFDMITLRFNKAWPEYEEIGNVNAYRISSPKLFFPFIAFFKALKLHRKNKYDIIWSIMANRAGFSALFFKIFHPKIKFLLTLQEGDALDYPKKQMGIFWVLLKPLFIAIFSRADYIQAISNYLANWAKDMGAKDPIEIVPNGVDLNKFKSQSASWRTNLKISELKEKLNIKNGEKILITTSRLVPKNAVDDIIKSLKYLPENVKFLVLGEGPDLEKMQNLTKEIGVEKRVIFEGFVDYRDLPKYLKISDVFIRPSLSEGLGSSFLEAMAADIPVIGTPVGGIPDFLKDPSNSSGQAPTGLFCEVKNPKSIAEKVKTLMENNELREKIIKNARELVLKNYDWGLISQRMGDIFNKLLAPLEI